MVTSSDQFRDAQNWTGIIFGVYNGVSAIYALMLPKIASLLGKKKTHAFSLLAGGVGLISMYFANDKTDLILSMIGVGFAWASILAMPYAILSASLPAEKMGVYMGVFNGTITVPQIAAGLLGGVLLSVVGGNAVFMLGVAGVSMLIAGLSVVFVK